MLDELKLLLGEGASAFSEAQITLALKLALAEIEIYTGINAAELDGTLELIAERIAVIKLNRLGSEGLTSQALSGVTEAYADGYPEDIKALLNRRRRLKVL